jgi:UDP-N-acetylmuramoyl-L-alanyl-D-glutamate--2,6-diaminopimelate ligase
MEASSIGIAQKRFNKIEFEAAAFSTFTQDHLDYHESMENYMHAKLELFKENMAQNAKFFVSDSVYQSIVQMLGSNYLDQNYSIIGSADFCDVQIKSHKFDLSGQTVDFLFQDKNYHFTTSIVGGFQAYNMLFAIMLVQHLGFDINDILKVVGKVICVKGRLEKIAHPFKHIFVDYAHNPDALESVLLELGKLKPSKSKIITVFGCGGDRDKGKRSIMGSIASRLSDFVIITDDNPRSEDPEQIRMQICSGIAKNNYKIIENRKNAIINALNLMNNYDILLIAGKGHEEYQIYNDKIIHFSDAEVVNQNIK